MAFPTLRGTFYSTDLSKKGKSNFGMPLCINYWVYELLHGHKEQVLEALNGTSFFVPFCAKRSQNCIFSSLRIEAKLIENLLPLGIKDDELHFNKRPEYA